MNNVSGDRLPIFRKHRVNRNCVKIPEVCRQMFYTEFPELRLGSDWI